MVARARDAFGPFEELETPVIEENAAWHAPGHNSVVADDEGSDWIVYHAVRSNPQRLMLLDRIDWQEGWPRVEGNQPSASRLAAPVLRFPGTGVSRPAAGD
jgi:arabinan endo-1,5-alpha-L-arabinosidase